MTRSLWKAVPVLVAATVVTGVLAVFLHSQPFAIAMAVFAALVLVGTIAGIFGRSRSDVVPVPVPVPVIESRPIHPPAPGLSEAPPTDATDIADAPVTPEPTAETSTSQCVVSWLDAVEPQPEPEPEPEPPCVSAAPPVFAPNLPPGSEPCDVISALLGATRAAGTPVAAHLWLEDSEAGTLRLVEAQGCPRPEPESVEVSSGILGASLVSGTARFGPLEPSAHMGGVSARWRYTLPLSGSNLRGIAAVDFEGDEKPDMAILTTISATFRASLSGALALYVATTESETARILVETFTAIPRLLDPDDVLHTALDNAMSLTEAQTGSIMILDPATHRMRIAVAHGLPDDVVAETDIAEGDGIAGWVLASGQPVVIEDLKDRGSRTHRHGVKSAVCVPLQDELGIVGVLNVGCTAFHARHAQGHLETIETLGRMVVAALRNAWESDASHTQYFETLKALALAFESRDPYARGGTVRVVRLADAISSRFGISGDQAKAIRIAAMLHDVGMTADCNVLPSAQGPLSTLEWGMLKMHPIIAAEFMSEAPTLSEVIPIVSHHHERWDGSGYVAGLSGTEIPIGARILSVADAYVAMTSMRPYRSAVTHDEAVAELVRCSGWQFDPDVVRVAVDILGSTQRDDRVVN